MFRVLPCCAHTGAQVILDLICLASLRCSLGHASELTHVCLIRYCVVQILSLKKEMANLLGFKNYAELSLASKMVSGPQSTY